MGKVTFKYFIMKIQNKKILIYDISSKDVKTFLHTSTMREKKKVPCKRNTSLMILFIIHTEQSTNKISVFLDVMLCGLAKVPCCLDLQGRISCTW
jgi:hypothetical protein